MKKRKTYRTEKKAQANANGKLVYFVKGPPSGWRIQKNKRKKRPLKPGPVSVKAHISKGKKVKAYIRRKAHNNNKEQFQTVDVKVNLFIDKVLKVHDLIENYWRTKDVRDDIVRQKSLAKIETNWQWIVNILNEELLSLENKIADLIK